MISHLVITTIVLVATLIIVGSLLLQSRIVLLISEVVALLVNDVLFVLLLVFGMLFPPAQEDSSYTFHVAMNFSPSVQVSLDSKQNTIRRCDFWMGECCLCVNQN
jgi:hypothetical protein